MAEGEDRAACGRALLDAALELCAEERLSSLHVLFPDEEEAAEWEALGLVTRLDFQFHWRNAGYPSFDAFLARFDSKRRNAIRRERAAPARQGIEIRTLRGPEVAAGGARLAGEVFALHRATVDAMEWGMRFVNRPFFERLFEAMPDAVEVVEARREGRLIGAALNLASAGRLYGRYWGCAEEHPFLHFNVCLYHSVDDCIRLGRKAFEPGAGGEHKISRGFVPTAIHSAHYLFDRTLDRVIRDFVVRERAEVEAVLASAEEVAGMRPFAGRK